MKKIILYSAQSINGKIARADGSVDWLERIPHDEGEDYGYAAFYESIGITIQGNNTYQQILNWGIEFPYKEKKNFVLTRKIDLVDNEDVTFINADHINAVKDLKEKATEDIWLVGGSQVNTLLLNAGLIDELLLFIMPIIIPDGISLFENDPEEKHLKLLDQTNYNNGVIGLRYSVSPTASEL